MLLLMNEVFVVMLCQKVLDILFATLACYSFLFCIIFSFIVFHLPFFQSKIFNLLISHHYFDIFFLGVDVHCIVLTTY